MPVLFNESEIQQNYEAICKAMELCSIEPPLFHKPFMADIHKQKERLNVNHVINLENKKSLMYCLCSIYGFSLNCCLDTGASVVFINKAIVQQMQTFGYGEPDKLLEPLRVKIGNSEVIYADEKIDIPLEIDGGIYPTQAYIIENLPNEIILGMSFFRQYNAILQPEENTMVLDTDYRATSSINGVVLTQMVEIPPNCETLVDVECESCNGQNCLVGANQALEERFGIHVARGFIQCNSKMRVAVSNFTNETVTLIPGTLIAKLNPMQLDQIDVIPLSLDFMEEKEVSKIRESLDNAGELKCIKINSKLSNKEKKKLGKLLKRYNKLFMDPNPKEHSRQNKVQHPIDTGNELPIHSVPYRVSPKERDEISKQINEMITKGVIQPSRSPWSSPVVLVNKKDGTVRFCVDYRKLNAITKKDVYPLPRIDDALASFHDVRYFSTLDLICGYWQVPVRKSDQEKTAFVTHNGLYEFTVMPFGLSNAPATFQRLMDMVLAGLKWKSCLVYLDDIIVFSRTYEEHLTHLEEVFQRLEEHELRLKPSKCYLCYNEIIYLGHRISKDGVAPDPAKVEAITKMPKPRDITELRSFLGLCNYYRNFIHNFADKMSPLYNITKSNMHFQWLDQHDNVFKQIKEELTREPILRHPDFNFPFIIQTDASNVGIGAVLVQWINDEYRVIQYISRILQAPERKWSTREKEALAILWACEQFRPYIIGSHFTVETDHQSLKWLLEAKAPARLVRWALRLSEFDFEIRYRRGSQNANADALSRLPQETSSKPTEVDAQLEEYLYQQEIILTELLPNITKQEWREKQETDLILHEIIQILEQDLQRNRRDLEIGKRYEIKDTLLFKKDPKRDRRALVVPQELRENVLRTYHEHETGGHVGRDRLYQLLSKRYYWMGMHNDVSDYVAGCLKCQTRKPAPPLRHGELQPIHATHPLQIVGIDIMGPLQISYAGHKYILVMIDHFTNWVEAEPLKSLEADETVDVIYRRFICRHGCPKTILTDRGTQFTSDIFARFCVQSGIRHLKTTAYHPQTNGKTERFNRFIAIALSLVIDKNQKNWDHLLYPCLLAYHSTIHKHTEETPYYLMHGRDPILPADLITGAINENQEYQDPIDYKVGTMGNLKKTYEKVNERYLKIKKKYKEKFDEHQKQVEFKEGDLVLVYTPTTKKGYTKKFLAKWEGPYKIEKKLGNLTYRVNKSENNSVSTHVQRLKKFVPFLSKLTAK